MKFRQPITWIILFMLVSLISCSRKSQPVSHVQTGGSTMASPPCIVYKTNADYSHLVPVALTADKTRISSYPDVTDIRKQGEGVYPQLLTGGYLLDNRGIGPDAAFLSISYEDYQMLSKTPSAEELFRMLQDVDPITEMYQCGNRYQYRDIVPELNTLIESGKLSECKKIK